MRIHKFYEGKSLMKLWMQDFIIATWNCPIFALVSEFAGTYFWNWRLCGLRLPLPKSNIDKVKLNVQIKQKFVLLKLIRNTFMFFHYIHYYWLDAQFHKFLWHSEITNLILNNIKCFNDFWMVQMMKPWN